MIWFEVLPSSPSILPQSSLLRLQSFQSQILIINDAFFGRRSSFSQHAWPTSTNLLQSSCEAFKEHTELLPQIIHFLSSTLLTIYGPTSIWGVKPSFARMANTNCLSRSPAREKKTIMNYCIAYFLTVVE